VCDELFVKICLIFVLMFCLSSNGVKHERAAIRIQKYIVQKFSCVDM